MVILARATRQHELARLFIGASVTLRLGYCYCHFRNSITYPSAGPRGLRDYNEAERTRRLLMMVVSCSGPGGVRISAGISAISMTAL